MNYIEWIVGNFAIRSKLYQCYINILGNTKACDVEVEDYQLVKCTLEDGTVYKLFLDDLEVRGPTGNFLFFTTSRPQNGPGVLVIPQFSEDEDDEDI